MIKAAVSGADRQRRVHGIRREDVWREDVRAAADEIVCNVCDYGMIVL